MSFQSTARKTLITLALFPALVSFSQANPAFAANPTPPASPNQPIVEVTAPVRMPATPTAPAAPSVSATTEAPVGAAAQENAFSLDGLTLSGTVLETMNSAGYTYLLLDAEQGKVWIAIPETTLGVGQAVVCAPGITMKNFESKTLKRVFASIIFSPGLDRGAAATTDKSTEAKTTAHKTAVSKPAATQQKSGATTFADALQAEQAAAATDPLLVSGDSTGSVGAVVASANVNVNKADGANSYAVGECFTKAKELSGKTVRVRGKVMKVSRMIMGKNWVHLQDGTGDPLKNQHDLVVTTLAEPKDDAVITVEGVLNANRDFGAGYSYEVLIEDAKIEP